MQTSRPRRTFQPPPTPRRALSPGFLPGAFSSWSASPAPAALYSTLASRRSLYSRLSMDRSRERSRLPTCRDLGYAQGRSFWALKSREGKLGLKGTCLGKGVLCPLWVESASTGRSKGGWREGGSETGSGFFKGVGGESGTGVMSLPVGPRPPLPPKGPPPYTHRFRCASSHVTGNPRNPPSLGGGGGHVGRGEPRGPGRERA